MLLRSPKGLCKSSLLALLSSVWHLAISKQHAMLSMLIRIQYWNTRV